MTDKIFQRLKAELTKDGRKTSLNDRTLTAYANLIGANISEESQIDEAIKPYIGFASEIDGNINSVVSEAVKTVKTATPPASPATPAPAPATPAQPTTDIPEWAKILLNKVDNLESQTKTKATYQTLEERLKGKVHERFYKPRIEGRTFESSEEMDSFVNAIEADYKEVQQAAIDEALKHSGRPGGGNGNPNKGEASAAEIEKMAAAMGMKK